MFAPLRELLKELDDYRVKWAPLQRIRGAKGVYFLIYFNFFPERRFLTTSTNLLPCSAIWHKLQAAVPAACDRSLPWREEMKQTLCDYGCLFSFIPTGLHKPPFTLASFQASNDKV